LYNRTIITDAKQLEPVLTKIKQSKGWLAFDTETTGLHLQKDQPFLFTFSFGSESYAMDLNEFEVPDLQKLMDSFQVFDFVMGHNVKYDLHMLANCGVYYNHNNLTDTMTMARLALDTDATMSLALKQLSKKYLFEDAGEDEKVIKTALTALKRLQTAKLKELLREHGVSKTEFDRTISDTVFEPSDLGVFASHYTNFLKENPEPNYEDVYKTHPEAMMSYAMNDTELTLELAKKMYPVLKVRDQMDMFKRENDLIRPLFEMERVGLNIDREYLETSRKAMKEYILTKRQVLKQSAGEALNVGQHKRIKEIFEEKFNTKLTSTDDRNLQTIEGGAKLFAETIRELRTLEKWYSAYILRMLESSAYDGRAYTQINQSTAVTGRVSSDFQQFPRHAIYKNDGKELFHPRKMVIVSGGEYNSIYYLDYSQIELRVQANYTYDISGGDLNMCRAYMPHACKNAAGEDFDPKEHRDLIFAEKWFTNESNEIWEPVDLHTATARQAFPDVDPKAPEFKDLRHLGKSTNFAKNYGATTKALMEQFGFDKKTAEKLNQAYYDAFPKILDYQKVVTDTFMRRGFVKNRYGRRYYLENKRFVYKMYNYIIQGTCADMLKEKIIEVHQLLSFYKSRFQMNIHDEMSFEIADGEEFLIPVLKEIMEHVDWMTVPVVADVEKTTTNWAAKESI
jgi:DNA polymerase-1